jgi:hypothetical protein
MPYSLASYEKRVALGWQPASCAGRRGTLWVARSLPRNHLRWRLNSMHYGLWGGDEHFHNAD